MSCNFIPAFQWVWLALREAMPPGSAALPTTCATCSRPVTLWWWRWPPKPWDTCPWREIPSLLSMWSLRWRGPWSGWELTGMKADAMQQWVSLGTESTDCQFVVSTPLASMYCLCRGDIWQKSSLKPDSGRETTFFMILVKMCQKFLDLSLTLTYKSSSFQTGFYMGKTCTFFFLLLFCDFEIKYCTRLNVFQYLAFTFDSKKSKCTSFF